MLEKVMKQNMNFYQKCTPKGSQNQLQINKKRGPKIDAKKKRFWTLGMITFR